MQHASGGGPRHPGRSGKGQGQPPQAPHREKRHRLRRSDTLNLGDLPDDFGHHLRPADPRGATLSLGETEQRLIRTALERAGWNRTAAARNLSIPRHVLIYRMKKYEITPPGRK